MFATSPSDHWLLELNKASTEELSVLVQYLGIIQGKAVVELDGALQKNYM